MTSVTPSHPLLVEYLAAVEPRRSILLSLLEGKLAIADHVLSQPEVSELIHLAKNGPPERVVAVVDATLQRAARAESAVLTAHEALSLAAAAISNEGTPT